MTAKIAGVVVLLTLGFAAGWFCGHHHAVERSEQNLLAVAVKKNKLADDKLAPTVSKEEPAVQVRSVDPKRIRAAQLSDQGLELAQREDLTKAMELLQEALDLDPDNLNALQNYSNLLIRAQDHAAALPFVGVI